MLYLAKLPLHMTGMQYASCSSFAWSPMLSFTGLPASWAPLQLCVRAPVHCAQGLAVEETCVLAAGDVERAQELVFNSRGIQRARDLAAQHAQLAAQAVSRPLITAPLSAAALCCIWVTSACLMAASCLCASPQLSKQHSLACDYGAAGPYNSSMGGAEH